MADINVERKSGPPIWLWIVGLVILGLIIWAIASMMGRDDTVRTTAADTALVATQPTGPVAQTGAMPAAAATFMRDCHVAQGTQTPGMGLDHEFAVTCFEQLANSIESLAQERGTTPAIDQQVQVMRDRAQQIRQSGPATTEHANWAREAAEAGAEAFRAMHPRWHAGDTEVQTHVENVSQAAQRIEADDLLHDEQLTDVRSYFRAAGDALNAMAQRRPA
jgi:hypothetical protein